MRAVTHVACGLSSRLEHIEIYGRVPRTKTNEQMLDSWTLSELGWRGLVFIVDDNFLGNKRNVRRLVPEVIEWSECHKRPFSFFTEASINLAEEDDLLERICVSHCCLKCCTTSIHRVGIIVSTGFGRFTDLPKGLLNEG